MNSLIPAEVASALLVDLTSGAVPNVAAPQGVEPNPFDSVAMTNGSLVVAGPTTNAPLILEYG